MLDAAPLACHESESIVLPPKHECMIDARARELLNLLQQLAGLEGTVVHAQEHIRNIERYVIDPLEEELFAICDLVSKDEIDVPLDTKMALFAYLLRQHEVDVPLLSKFGEPLVAKLMAEKRGPKKT